VLQIVSTLNTAAQTINKNVSTDEMAQAHTKVVGLALKGAQTERKAS
jgi:hypothetical protein